MFLLIYFPDLSKGRLLERYFLTLRKSFWS